MTLDEFPGVNAGYVLDLYERYRRDPASVDAETRKAFEAWTPVLPSAGAPASGGPANFHAIVGAANLAESIRRYGHLAAQIDPLLHCIELVRHAVFGFRPLVDLGHFAFLVMFAALMWTLAVRGMRRRLID